jgi:seryl-tRNA(Sec) selenium transferase
MCHAGVTPSLPHGGLSLQQQQQLPSFLQQLPLFLQQQQQQQQLKQLQQQQQQQQQLQQLQQQLQQLQQPLVLQPTSVSTPAPRTRRSAGPPASKRL